MARFSDLHCHPSMKPYSKAYDLDPNNIVNNIDPSQMNSIWNETNKHASVVTKVVQEILGVVRYKECDMSKLNRGEVRLVFLSITPPERGFFEMKKSAIVEFFSMIDPDLLPNFVTDFGDRRIDEFKAESFDYFKDLNNEYQFIAQLDGTVIPDLGQKYVIAKRGQSLKSQLDANSGSTLVVLTVEGGHSLFSGSVQDVFSDARYPLSVLNDRESAGFQELLALLKGNIAIIKNQWANQAHCPFFLTLNHHFWNMLAGQAVSLADILVKLVDQSDHVNSEITELGKEVVDMLLSTDNGPRILIDAKHMSAKCRSWFYGYIALHNSKHPEDNIPVISSHTAANNYSNIVGSDEEEVCDGKIIANDKYKKSDIYNNWSIGLSDEEIALIIASDGLIGISMDKRIVSGYQLKIKFPTIMDGNSEETMKRWAEPFFNQVAKIYQIARNKKTSDFFGNMCIGSDFDGIINPLNAYDTAEAFELLSTQLTLLMKNSGLFPGDDIDAAVEKIMHTNAIDFAERYFH